ncbi:MAG TPA: hypothetical protein VK509_11285, partial [Polyangiales bacterium]|nr:hypothetical protein [Polyangiales bacterium]
MQPRARSLPALALAFAGWLIATAPASPAQAYEDQFTLGLGLGYAHAFPSGAPHPGALTELSASTGLDPTWTARARLAAAWHPSERALYRGIAGAELLYMIDVLELVPSLGLGLDGMVTRLPPASDDAAAELRGDLAAHAVLGLDYLLSRELSLGLDVRPHLLITALDDEPLYLTISA